MAKAAATNDTPTHEFNTSEELFDSIGPGYETAFANLQPQLDAIDWILQQLQDRKPAKVLDVGCGTGRPVCSALADAGHDVLGVDSSGVMLADARAKVPNATFQQVDVFDLDFPPGGSFDAVTSFFSMIVGTSQAAIKNQITKMYDWVKPGGVFVFGAVPISVDQQRVHFLGRSVIASSLSAEEFLECITQAGFEVVHHSVSSFKPKAVEAGITRAAEDEAEPHQFIYAKKQ